jgi:hypothetical protein
MLPPAVADYPFCVSERDVRLTGGDPEGVVKGLGDSTMSNKWRFPTSGGQSIIEAEFVVGEP